MAQNDPTIGANQSGLAFRTAYNAGIQSSLSANKGSTAPSYQIAGTIWIDDAATPWKVKVYDGADQITIGEINATTNTFMPYIGTAGLRLLNHATDTGAADAYALAPVPAITAYATGQVIAYKPANANTGASTVNVCALGVKSIKTPWGTDPGPRTLRTTEVALLMYDGTNFIHLNPPPYVQGAAIASAGTLNLDNATGDFVHVTGTTTVTAITLAQGREVTVVFDGALTLTNGASLINLGGANITTAAGDCAVFRGEASGVVRMVNYEYVGAFTSGVLLKGGGGNKISNSGINVSSGNGIDGYIGSFNDQTGTTYTTVDSDTGKILTFSNAAAIAVTLENSSPKGTAFTWYQKGAGQVTFAAEAGGSMVNRSSHTKSGGQYAGGTLFVESNSGTDAKWVLVGDTTA